MKNKSFLSVVGFCFLSLLLCPTLSWAGAAELLLSPTRIVLEDGKKFATVTVRNNGNATGRYKISLIDAAMSEEGGITMRDEGVKEPHSALDLVSLSPRNMTLKPDQNMPIRLLVKNYSELPDGEYRSHLHVLMTDNDINPTATTALGEGTGIVLKTKMATVIPVIIRKGKTEYKLTMEDAKLVMGGGDGKQVPEIKTSYTFSGNRSVLGDIKVTHIAPDGKETQILFFRGIAIYRGVEKRTQTVALKDIPAGVNIHSGKLHVAFMSQENEGSRVLTSKEITP